MLRALFVLLLVAAAPAAASAGQAPARPDGMPPEIARQLEALYVSGREVIPETAKIYATQPRVYKPSDIKTVKNVPYGAHERQQIDIHTAAVRPQAQPAPVIVVFHGGGLVGGNRAAYANVPDYFASLGMVGVNGGYRLAPEAKWPDGGRDVGLIVSWLHQHVAEYGGNPDQIFLVGISTGALHAATYVFRPELLPPGTPRVAGAVLVSGPYSFDFDDPTKGELAYFGEDRARWAEMMIPGHVTRADIPVLFTTAEWDTERYQRPFAELFSELVLKHGARPRFRQSIGHNHTSQLLSVGTVDTSVSREILDFISRNVRR